MLRDFDVSCQCSILLEHASGLLLHRRGVDLVLISHMRVLLAPLLKSLGASQHRTSERFFACMNADMVL